MSEEIRVTDPTTGGQKGSKPERYDLIPVDPLAEVARIYGYGAGKYAENNWRRGYKWSLSYAALQRHLNQFWGGESYDSESKVHHLASVVFHALALMEFDMKKKGTDDRWSSQQTPLSSSETWPLSDSPLQPSLWPTERLGPTSPSRIQQPSLPWRYGSTVASVKVD